MREAFRKFAAATARVVGSPWIFVLAVLLIVGWALSGPVFGYSDTWQLVINTTTTIVTFLMVFLIQNTQNRDSEAIHLKLDELIRALHTARTRLVDLEDLSDAQLEQLREEFQRLREIHSGDGDATATGADQVPLDRRVPDSPEGSGTPGRRAGDSRPKVER
ncbi:MAG TPA: low affinity iron permease family protein [Gemmatimonadaceae bacterium]|jgi:low affinity Fe/Cu permease|nr:low affinity iron permease family protein [Gemmatimonadaceae bacterium]